MPSFSRHFRRFPAFPVVLLWTALSSSALAQEAQTPRSSSPASINEPRLTPPKPPALVDPTGPAISLQTSESLFDVAVALNACGYDQDLEKSDPLRQHVRDEVNQYLQGSEKAREARDRVCAYIAAHRLANSGRDLAQYVSLGLYLTPPPELAPSVDLTDMPPDSTQVVEIVPLLRDFVNATDLHVVWVANHAAYEQEVAKLHDPLTKMILANNIYLKMPASGYDGRRFLVVLEPLLAPSQTNARVYGTDYVVVASPSSPANGGSINMQQVRHTYLHYEIEPLLFSRASSMDRMLPLLKAVRSAPLDYTFRSDIVALVTESLIRAVEARTFDTGIPEVKNAASARFADMAEANREKNVYLQKVAAARQENVNTSMAQGFVLTQYFYDALGQFEREPASLKESIGEMVYGMNAESEIGRAKHIQFAESGGSDVVSHAPRQLHGLDLAQAELIKGDKAGAARLAQQALDQKSGDPAYADYILGQVALLSGKIEEAQGRFGDAVRLSKDPRTLAWSHIYLGRIHDVEEEREEAVAEYQAALTVRDGQADTKQAAEKGLKQPFALPGQTRPKEDSDPTSSKHQ
jgi:hypothetical protein